MPYVSRLLDECPKCKVPMSKDVHGCPICGMTLYGAPAGEVSTFAFCPKCLCDTPRDDKANCRVCGQLSRLR